MKILGFNSFNLSTADRPTISDLPPSHLHGDHAGTSARVGRETKARGLCGATVRAFHRARLGLAALGESNGSRRFFNKGEGGRPKGAKNRLSWSFLSALADDFEQFGIETIRICRIQRPHEYLKVVAGLMPKELEFTDNTLQTVTDDELALFIEIAPTPTRYQRKRCWRHCKRRRRDDAFIQDLVLSLPTPARRPSMTRAQSIVSGC